ncbi:MAG: hypothetical protein IJW63_10950 [Lachnospiraceae bacterium]|nr:hypothetical protein [Lachnospiraceae bacterium]
MRITFENQNRNVDKTTTEYRSASPAKEGGRSTYALDISGTVMDNTAYGLQGRTAEEVMQSAGAIDVALIRDYMTVMSNSMSDEDFAKLQKEGYCPTDTDIETVVTIVDKIKAEMAKGGAHVVGYTDTLDQDVLEEIAGSTGYANAMAKAQQLTPLTEGQMGYMLDNQMQPTIDDLYKAQFSGADRGSRGSGAFYREDTKGYFAKKATGVDLEEIQGQIEQILTQAGMEVSEETLKQASFLIEHTIPLTASNMQDLSQLQGLELPVSEELVKRAIFAAALEGKEAGQANLADPRTIYDKTVSIDSEIDILLERASAEGNASKYRQLQEVRLMMTVEANVKLLRSGFSIDTTEIEKLVDALKEMEAQQAQQLFPESEDQTADYTLYKETVATKAELMSMPAALVGSLREPVLSQNLTQITKQGLQLQAKYKEAGESYETLMTAPRADMGDRIQKAFRNVDDILRDLDFEITSETQRAVRILGYNNMEITPQNIEAVMETDRDLQRVISKMTPPSVVKMIRDGINPLKVSLGELEQYLDANPSFEEEAEKYSKYLYKLEHSGEITEQEKESYIGIYRMLRQIEKTDSASIGALIHSGSEVTFANILTSIRSGKAKGLDVKLGQQYGALEELARKEVTISQQIEQGYVKRQAEEARNAANAPKQDVALLHEAGIAVTVDNLLAAKQIRLSPSEGFRKLREKATALSKIPEALGKMENLEDTLTDTAESVEAYSEFAKQLSDVAEELTFSETESLDVRAMQIVHKQFHILGALAKQEEYQIPMLLDDQVATVKLTLKHDEGKQGMVEITTDAQSFGSLEATFWMDAEESSAFLVAETLQGEEALKQVANKMETYLTDKGYKKPSIGVTRSLKAGNLSKVKAAVESTKKVATKDLYELARTYIKVLKETLS